MKVVPQIGGICGWGGNIGAELSEGRGSRVRVLLNDVIATFHRPHPRKEAEK